MFFIRLDPKASDPLYLQIYKHIKAEITSGNYPPDMKLPSKRQLSTHLQCSQNTVQNAYNQLSAEGYIMSRLKSGYYVSKLDGVLSLNNEKVQPLENNDSRPDFKYDFSHHGVDLDSFPFSVWRKLNKEVIDEYDLTLLRACEPQGDSKLRQSIANYLHQSRGVNCRAGQIIISSGTEFILQLLIQLFDGDYIYALENPGYEKLNLIFKSNRVRYEAISLDESGMRPDILTKSGANVACVTPSHQFPTGNIMPISRRIQLLNWARESENRYIIEDDYDSEFKYSGKPIPSLQGLDSASRVVYIGAFSKSLTPSIRISYMVLPERLLTKYNDVLSFYLCPVPLFEQKALHRFISEGYFERHLNKMRNIYKRKMEALIAAVNTLLPDSEISGASAGLHLVLKVNNGMPERELEASASDSGVRVYGLSRFFIGEATEKSSVLLGFASLREEEIFKAVQLLRRAWVEGC